MARIFINGLNAKSGGGKSILTNYLSVLSRRDSTHTYFVLTPTTDDYSSFENDFIKIIKLNELFNKQIIYPFVYAYVLPKVLSKLKVDVILNLADVPIRTKIKQVFLFDWPYAVYPNSIVWDKMDLKSKIIRKTKLFYFKRYLEYIDVMIAQSETIKIRLTKLYGINDIKIVPNAVSLDNMHDSVQREFNLPVGIKLLYLTHYYQHKNLEIFIPLAKEIRSRGLNFKLVTTIEANQHLKAKEFLQKVEDENLTTIICNIGAVDMKHVPSLYKQCDGLLMPTLLESFSGTYVEAMFHKKPILTSDIDFAKGVCNNAAIYFDPMDVDKILSKIELVFTNPQLKDNLIDNGTKVLKSLPTWYECINLYESILDKALEK